MWYIYVRIFEKGVNVIFSALCEIRRKRFFSPETISKVDDVKTKGNVFFFSLFSFDLLTLSRCLAFFFCFSALFRAH